MTQKNGTGSWIESTPRPGIGFCYFPSFFTKSGQFLLALATFPSKSALNFFRMSAFRLRYNFSLRTCHVLMSTGNSLPRPTPYAQNPPHCGAYLYGFAVNKAL